jgi:hypothetical protein
MPPTEYCVYNETRSNCFIPRVTVIDAQSEPLKAVKVLIEGLAPESDTALWLNPLKCVPSVPRLSPYDLVYLDQEGRVVHSIELVPDDEAPRFDGPAASALVLPIHSFNASGTLPGDRVLLRPSAEPIATSAPSASSSALPFQASLPLEPVVPEPAPVRAWTSAFAANPFLPEPFRASETPLPSDASSAPPQSVLPFNEPLPSPASPPARKLRAFNLLRPLARLRIRVQISIILEPIAAHCDSGAPSPTPLNGAQPRERPRPLLVRRAFRWAARRASSFAIICATGVAAIRSAATTAIRQAARASTAQCASFRILTRTRAALRHGSARLADRYAFCSTVTLPILVEHTLPTTAERGRRSLVRAYTSWRKAYLRWADAFFYGPRAASIDRFGADPAVRRPPASVREIETRRDPVRQLLRPPN